MDKELSMFGCEKHYDSLVEFIKNVDVSECAYKISIQGDWGLGKTKAMEYIIAKLRKDTENISIIEENGWKLSNEVQKGSDVSYFVSHLIINDLIEIVSGENKDNAVLNAVEKAKGFAKSIKGINLGPIAIDSGNIESTLESIYKRLDNQSASLKEISKFYDSNKNHRFVIFIDDLDRLKPAVAVEILEQIHTNLNLRGCVFVIAIDFDVVKRGVQAKYGDDFGKEKAMQFFEKIIQLPYDLPNKQYDLLEYIKEELNEYDDQDLAEEYKVITEHFAVDRNPRRINRAFDLAKFYEGILEDKAAGISGWKKWTYLVFLFKVYYPECFETLKNAGEDYSQKTYGVLFDRFGRIESEEGSYKEADSIDDGYLLLNSFFGKKAYNELSEFSSVIDILFESTEGRSDNNNLYGKLFEMFGRFNEIENNKKEKVASEIREENEVEKNPVKLSSKRLLRNNIDEVSLYSENKKSFCSLKVRAAEEEGIGAILDAVEGNEMFEEGQLTSEKAPKKLVYSVKENKIITFSRINLFFEQSHNRNKFIKFLSEYIFNLEETDVKLIIKHALGDEYKCEK